MRFHAFTGSLILALILSVPLSAVATESRLIGVTSFICTEGDDETSQPQSVYQLYSGDGSHYLTTPIGFLFRAEVIPSEADKTITIKWAIDPTSTQKSIVIQMGRISDRGVAPATLDGRSLNCFPNDARH